MTANPSRRTAGALALLLAGLQCASVPAFSRNLLKDMHELGTRVATAQACGLSQSDMRGSMYRYSEELNLRSAILTHAVHSYDEAERTVTASEIKSAYIEGTQLPGTPPPQACKKFKKKWAKYDQEQLKLGDQAYVEVSRVLAGG